MLKLLTKVVAALSLVVPASFAEPAWSAETKKSSANCSKAKSQRHGKLALKAKPPARGVGSAQTRRTPDVQIFSYGP